MYKKTLGIPAKIRGIFRVQAKLGCSMTELYLKQHFFYRNSPRPRFGCLGLLLFISLSVIEVSAQISGNGVVKGKIIDSLSSAPVSFATIRIFKTSDNKLVNG